MTYQGTRDQKHVHKQSSNLQNTSVPAHWHPSTHTVYQRHDEMFWNHATGKWRLQRRLRYGRERTNTPTQCWKIGRLSFQHCFIPILQSFVCRHGVAGNKTKESEGEKILTLDMVRIEGLMKMLFNVVLYQPTHSPDAVWLGGLS